MSYEATMARIQDIQSKLGMFADPLPPPIPVKTPVAAPLPGFTQPGTLPGTLPGVKAGAIQQPFNLQLAQANGSLTLQPTGNGGPPFAPYIEALISKHAAQNGLPPELVRAVIRQESDGNPRDVSHAGARGLMQLMPEEIHELGVTDPFDPEQNIAAGTRLLSGLLKQYKGDTPLALAAYNAGSGAVKKYNGIPPYAETQQYVKRIMGMVGK